MNQFSIDTESVVNKPLLEALEEIANCNICKNIVWNPMECSKCEHCFCKTCIENWFSKAHSCPFKCTGMFLKESRMARAMLSNLLFKCDKCDEVIKYDNYESHATNCTSGIFANNNKSKFEKYDEVETEDHEHSLEIIKDCSSMNNKQIKYYWTCSKCNRNFAMNIHCAYCSNCNFKECEECILGKNNKWLIHVCI